MEQPDMLPMLYPQYYACWCPGDFRSQGVNGHGIDQISRNIPSPAQEELTTSTGQRTNMTFNDMTIWNIIDQRG